LIYHPLLVFPHSQAAAAGRRDGEGAEEQRPCRRAQRAGAIGRVGGGIGFAGLEEPAATTTAQAIAGRTFPPRHRAMSAPIGVDARGAARRRSTGLLNPFPAIWFGIDQQISGNVTIDPRSRRL
jgi:hypothetical protein